MSGTPQIWTPVRDQWLIAQITAQVTAKGRMDWGAMASTEVSAAACKCRYQTLSMSGRSPRIAAMILDYRRGQPIPQHFPIPDKPSEQHPEQEVTTKVTDEGIEARSHGKRIRTVEDLLAHIKADLTKYEVASCEATRYEMGSVDAEKHAVITELHRVFVRLRPKAGPSVRDVLGTVIDAAFAKRQPFVVRPVLKDRHSDILETWVIPEPHIGKYAWNAETGHGDYDVNLAVAGLRQAVEEIHAAGLHRGAGERVIACLGDFYHTDNVSGHTTRGTPMDSDGRIQRTIDAGARLLFDLIDTSAQTARTTVLITPGNHDEVLSWALQRILLSHFRNDKRVTINTDYQPRKYMRWGKTLLGFTHGDRPPAKKLASVMAIERPVDWGETTYREIHSGHQHATAAIQTIEGVVTRTCASLSPPDKWHNDNAFLGGTRTMESFFYHKRGALIGMESSRPMGSR